MAANAARERDDEFLLTVASWVPKAMGTEPMTAQVAFVLFDAAWIGLGGRKKLTYL